MHMAVIRLRSDIIVRWFIYKKSRHFSATPIISITVVVHLTNGLEHQPRLSLCDQLTTIFPLAFVAAALVDDRPVAGAKLS